VPWAELFSRVAPILGFLVCITVVAELADGLGVFATIARGAARLAAGSILLLWLLVVLVAVVATAVLSLDTTAVLLTPVVLALARQLNLDRALFAYTAVWLANTASLFLPVSNLTNLLAVSAPGRPLADFVPVMAPAAITSVVVTVLVLAGFFRRSLRGRYRPADPEPVPHRGLLTLAIVVCPSDRRSRSGQTSWSPRRSRPRSWSLLVPSGPGRCSAGVCCRGRWSSGSACSSSSCSSPMIMVWAER
jgi:arsenical pump membrane protein